MPSPSFQIDQPTGAGTGTAGQSRKDLWQSTACNLVCNNPPPGATFLWSLLYKPPASTATIINPTSSTAQFTPDLVTQSYRLNLQINAGGPGLSFNFIVACTKNNTGSITNRGWRTPALDEQDSENNFAGNGNGYVPDYDQIILDLLANAQFSGSSGPSGYAYVTHTNSPYTVANTGTIHVDADVNAAPAGPIIIALPAAPTLMQYLEIKNPFGGAATYPIQVQGNGFLIDGASSYDIAMDYGGIILRFNGSAWGIL